jgi:hypothetical protein
MIMWYIKLIFYKDTGKSYYHFYVMYSYEQPSRKKTDHLFYHHFHAMYSFKQTSKKMIMWYINNQVWMKYRSVHTDSQVRTWKLPLH